MRPIQTLRSYTLLMMGGGLLLAGPAAADATGNLDIQVTVASNCLIGSTGLTFGTYDTLSGSAVVGQGNLQVACTLGHDGVIMLGQGANSIDGSLDEAPLRAMSNGTDELQYQLFTTVGRNVVWGNTLETSVPYTGLGTQTNVPVFGEILGGQTVTAGVYTDTVVATVTF